MPLLTKMLPLRETVEDFQAASLHSSHQQHQDEGQEKDKDSGYEDFQEFDEEDECLDSDMEGSIIHRGRPKKAVRAPAIPARNERRASKILENVMLELQTLDGKEAKDTDSRSMVPESDPHESYLSSEEDASLSDDYDDLESLSGTASPSAEDADNEEGRESFSRGSRRKSQEDTARVVSFICVGKPQIVDIFISSNHASPIERGNGSIPKRHSMNLEALTALTQTQSSSPAKSSRRPTPLKLYPNSIRRMSISSITSSHTSNSSYNQPAPTNASNTNLSSLPPRKSSRLALNINSLITSTKTTLQKSVSASAAVPSHSFLTSDPFSTTASNEDTQPTTPKTPTSIAAAAWKRGLSKTLTKARKPSMPKLYTAYTNSSSASISPDKKRISTAHSNLSSNNLARIISESIPDAETRSRSSVYSSASSQRDPAVEPVVEVKRSSTMPVLTSPTTSTSYIPPVVQKPPPIPASTTPVSAGGRRSFSLGLGRKKSVKTK
ncbi:uncharacterized protein LY89DRAFT_50810 [Mollisia scopiformis]|uniref:Uncharacterized protein n=1 Tax=Mollisia scopiformis TaxID=149040 RepID=A0A194XAX2_MOLSC|nr:uncharacterized protein LY89DRAFT_50810 [Mollisia scopiformis]KUJ17315.1 hypothetical protein LY89DRAFT_50810 [Mollisia scopiformis]